MKFVSAAHLTGGGTISGDLTIAGDLTVTGVGGGFAYTEVITGDVQITSNVAGAADIFIIKADDDGNLFRVGKDASDDAYVEMFDGDGNKDVQISTDGVSYFNGGNVGIGTASPGATLEVSGTGAIQSTYTGGSSAGVGGAIAVVQDDGAAIASGHRIGYLIYKASEDASNTLHASASINAYATELWSASQNGAKLNFEVTADGATSRSVAMTIASSGNVGIGTASPVSALHTYGLKTDPNLSADTGIFTVHSSSTGQLAFGGQSASPYSLWVQTKVAGNDGNSLPLAINPLGGNVGIGTASPGALLDIRRNDTGTTTSLVIRQLSSGDSSMDFQTTTSPYGFCIGVDGSDSDSFKIASGLGDVGTNTKLTIDTSGNVGIGNTAPSEELEVSASGTNSEPTLLISNYNDQPGFPGELRISKSNSDTLGTESVTQNGDTLGRIQFFGVDSSSNSEVAARIDVVQSATAGTRPPGDFLFITTNTSNSTAERVRITADGNLGIGGNPNLNGYGANTKILTIRDEGTAGDYSVLELGGHRTNDGSIGDISFNHLDGSGTTQARILIRAIRDGANDAAGLTFYTEATGAAISEKMRIDSAGNVGIGTAAPTAKLEVNSPDEVNDGDWIAKIINQDVTAGQSNGLKIQAGVNGTDRVFTIQSEAGAEYFEVDGAGSVGIGATPTTFHASLTGLQIGGNGILSSTTAVAASGSFKISQNVREEITSGDFTYISEDEASLIELSAGSFSFKTAPSAGAGTTATMTTRLSILQAGDVTVSTGNLIIATADKGISFTGGTDPDTSGTATANILDDYEEGTFLPTLLGSSGNPTQTYASGGQVGRYTKIGRFVYVHGRITMGTGITVGSGTARIGALPFTSNSATNTYGTINVSYGSSWGTNRGVPTAGYTEMNTVHADLQVHDNDAGNIAGTAGANAADIDDGTDLIFGGFYIT